MRSTLHNPLLTAENRLWRAVLEQAYVDAESGADAGDAQTDDGDGSHECLRARCYLRGDSKPDAAALVAVCSFAEIPADRLLNWARRNYPRPQTMQQLQQPQQHSPLRSRVPSQNDLAIGALEARQNRARSCEHASA
jgi:hypothetical protein